MTTEQASAQAYLADARNEDVLVYVNGAFGPRNEARVSVFDSGFVLGDGVWEGLRLVKGKLISLEAHLDRLFEGALDPARHRAHARGRGQGGPGHARPQRHDRRRACPSADEAFATGTLGGVTPVTKVDGRLIADGKAGPVTKEASDLYLRSVDAL